MRSLPAMPTQNRTIGNKSLWRTPVGNSIPLTQGTWMFSALDWVEESWTKTGKSSWHAEKKPTYMVLLWASKMTGKKEPAQLQARHTPRNTSYFTSPCSQLASTPGATFSGCLLPSNCKLKSSIVQGRCWSFAPLPQRIGNHHGQDTRKE